MSGKDNKGYQRPFGMKEIRMMRNALRIKAMLMILLVIAAVILPAGCQNDYFLTETQPSTPATPDSASPNEETPVAQESTELDPMISITDYIPADPADSGEDGVVESSGYLVWNRMAFMPFFADEDTALRYADSMNTAAEALGADIQVYSMIIPLHAEFGLPERLKTGESEFENTPAAPYLKTAYTAMDPAVTPVNPYNMLSAHCNEYIYFSSDHHWTGLGAYYAYTAFAQTAGLPVLDLNDCEECVIEDFTGSFMKTVSSDLETDAVHYWKFPYEVTDTITDENGGVNDYDTCYFDDIFGSGDGSYLVFIMGDQPLEVIKSSGDLTNNEKIAVIHESYGNAFIPYLTYDYSEVYSIDYRYWKGDLSDFCEENGITNVLYLNNVLSSATYSVMDMIDALA